LPLTKLIRTVGGGFRREKLVQTWLSGLRNECVVVTIIIVIKILIHGHNHLMYTVNHKKVAVHL